MTWRDRAKPVASAGGWRSRATSVKSGPKPGARDLSVGDAVEDVKRSFESNPLLEVTARIPGYNFAATPFEFAQDVVENVDFSDPVKVGPTAGLDVLRKTGLGQEVEGMVKGAVGGVGDWGRDLASVASSPSPESLQKSVSALGDLYPQPLPVKALGSVVGGTAGEDTEDALEAAKQFLYGLVRTGIKGRVDIDRPLSSLGDAALTMPITRLKTLQGKPAPFEPAPPAVPDKVAQVNRMADLMEWELAQRVKTGASKAGSSKGTQAGRAPLAKADTQPSVERFKTQIVDPPDIPRPPPPPPKPRAPNAFDKRARMLELQDEMSKAYETGRQMSKDSPLRPRVAELKDAVDQAKVSIGDQAATGASKDALKQAKADLARLQMELRGVKAKKKLASREPYRRAGNIKTHELPAATKDALSTPTGKALDWLGGKSMGLLGPASTGLAGALAGGPMGAIGGVASGVAANALKRALFNSPKAMRAAGGISSKMAGIPPSVAEKVRAIEVVATSADDFARRLEEASQSDDLLANWLWLNQR